jgi:hypothetical protein
MRIDNSDEKVIEYYDLYYDENDPGETPPVDLCALCVHKWPLELQIDHPAYDLEDCCMDRWNYK